jgi:UDP-N-acetylmuramoyl-tripeptide--D-alanyl-D-alanine ligase
MNFTVRLSSGRSPEQAAQVHLPLPGIHNAANALAAVAAAVGAGVPLAAAAAALASFQGMERRLAAFKLKNMLIIDDAYNANPTSFKAALAVLAACSAQRKFVVAGDMLELGAEAEPCHKKLGEHLAEISPAGLVAVGPLAALACQTAAKQGNMACHWVDSPEAAAECIYSLMCDGDAVLIKGSHSVGLDRTVVKLKQLFDLKNV